MTLSSDETCARILGAAVKVFAAKGFAGASVREITQLAQVNIAAINYHFRDKAGLYNAVLVWQFEMMTARFPALPAPDVPVTEFLRQLYRSMLSPSGAAEAQQFHQLLRQEENSPSGVAGQVWADLVKPRHDELVLRFAQEVGLSRATVDVHRLAKAVLDLGKGYTRDRQVLGRIAPALFEGEDWLEKAVHSLVEQAQDLISGLRTRLQQFNKTQQQ